MLGDRGVAERVAERHPPEAFRDAAYRELFGALLSSPLDDDLERIADRLSSESLRVMRELTEGSPYDVEAADIGLSLSKLDARVLEARIDEIREAMRTATREAQDQLMTERLELEAELRRLLPIRSPRTKPRG